MFDVLIVDDDPLIRQFVSTALVQMNYSCAVASDGHVATKMLQENSFRLILTDIYMPGMDGLEFIIRSHQLHPKTRIVAMSGGGQFSKSSSGLKPAAYLGCERIVTKPFDEADVILMVWELIGMGSLDSPPLDSRKNAQ